MALYKYMKKAHLNSFLSKGSLKIGTLYEYRAQEALGGAVGDRHEGMRFTWFSLPTHQTLDMSKDTPESRFFGSIFPNAIGRDIKISFLPDCGLNYVEQDPECFVYCVTNEFSVTAMEEFGYDACLEIVQPDGFFKAISRAIRHHADYLTCERVHYRNRQLNFPQVHHIPPCLIKGSDYAYQNEVRAIWQTRKKLVKPLFIDVPTAIKYCRPFDTRSS